MRLRWCMILEQNKIFLSNAVSAGGTESHVIDLAKLASSLNRKHIPNVDRNGNVQMFLVRVAPLSGTDVLTTVDTAPLVYTTKDAVKDWHDKRVQMFKDNGVKMSDLGPYARHLRPHLDVDHENGTVNELDTETSPNGFFGNTEFQGEEYTRTRVATTVPAKDSLTASVASYDLVDSYSLTLCGATIAEDGTADDPDGSGSVSDQDSFVSAGMIDSYLKSFKKKSLSTNDAHRIQSDNPLLQLNGTMAKEEVLEVAEDSAEEGRPWDFDGSQYIDLTTQAYIRTNSNVGPEAIIQVPCGLLKYSQVNGSSSQESLTTVFEIIDIYDM